MAKIMDYIRVGDYQSADAYEDGYVDFHMDPLDEFWKTFSNYYVGEEGIYESEGGERFSLSCTSPYMSTANLYEWNMVT
jgi:hypothetical protein